MKKFLVIVLIGTGAYLLFAFSFLWTNAIVDTYFYWAFGEFLKTGVYPFQAPFVYARPTTVSPPLYSVLMLLLGLLPRADIFLHALQLGLLALTAWLIYKLLIPHAKAVPALIIACLFAFIPANLIFSSYALTEIPSQFALTLLAFLLVRTMEKKSSGYGIWTLFLVCIMGLLKYSFLLYLPIALVISGKKKPHRTFSVLSVAGIALIFGWIMLNHQITGIWSISDNRGGHLWNHVVGTGNILPSENTPSLIKLRQMIPPKTDMYVFYWDIQQYILPYVGNSWPKVDDVLGRVAIDAIRQHPLTYAVLSAQHFVTLLHNGTPYWKNLSSTGSMDPVNPLYCSSMGNFSFCNPVIATPWSFNLWNHYILASNIFYERIWPWLTLGIFLPALIISFFLNEKRLKLLSLLYLFGVVPIAMVEHTDPRYLIPFYPLMLLISTETVYILATYIQMKRKIHTIPAHKHK